MTALVNGYSTSLFYLASEMFQDLVNPNFKDLASCHWEVIHWDITGQPHLNVAA